MLSIRSLKELYEFQIKKFWVDLDGLTKKITLIYMIFTKCGGD